MLNLQTKNAVFCVHIRASSDSIVVSLNQKSNLHYTRGITPKRVTSGGAHVPGLAPGQHSSEETSQRWRAVGCADLTGPGIEPQTSRTEGVGLATELLFYYLFINAQTISSKANAFCIHSIYDVIYSRARLDLFVILNC